MKSIEFYERFNSSIRDTLNSINQAWTKDQIIRYLYKALAVFVRRDLKYYLESNEEKKRQFELGFINRFPDIVCYTISEFYCAALREFGIYATVEKSNSADIPLYAIVVEGERGKYFLNPLEDLFPNQYGLMPQAFGIVPRFKTINMNHPNLVRLEKEYLESIDDSLGFTYIDQTFTNLEPQMKQFKSACTILNIDPTSRTNKDIREEKIAYFANNFINLGNVNGTFERALLYKFFTDRLMDKRERNHVSVHIEDGLTPKPYISFTIIRSNSENSVYHEEKTEKGYSLVLQKKI